MTGLTAVKKVSKLLRMPVWWNHIVPPILGTFYLLLFLGKAALLPLLPALGFFLLSILGTAGFGYWINDWADREQDKIAGKPNATFKFNLIQRWLILLGLTVVALFPWFFLPQHLYAMGLWGLLILFLFLYSVPPFRFKERNLLGPLSDMSYGHLLPIWITIGTFGFILEGRFNTQITLSISLSILLTLKGLRNIIQHQLEDRKKDKQSGQNTFVLQIGPVRAAYLISFILLPLELLSLSFLLIQLNLYLFLFFLFFLYTYARRIWSWKYTRSKSIRFIFRLWFVLNDFYEASFPLIVLLFLITLHWGYIFLLLLHLLLFSKSLTHWHWVWKAWEALPWWKEIQKYVV